MPRPPDSRTRRRSTKCSVRVHGPEAHTIAKTSRGLGAQGELPSPRVRGKMLLRQGRCEILPHADIMASRDPTESPPRTETRSRSHNSGLQLAIWNTDNAHYGVSEGSGRALPSQPGSQPPETPRHRRAGSSSNPPRPPARPSSFRPLIDARVLGRVFSLFFSTLLRP